jgi:hypothetical protein
MTPEQRKAQRQAERKENRKEARAQRAEDFKNQKVKDVKDFNFDQHNRKNVEGTHVSGQEVKHVRETGGRDAAYAALTAQKEAGATFGDRAQKKYDRMGRRIEKQKSREAAKEKAQAVKTPPSDNTTQPYNPPAQSPNPEDSPATQPSNQQVANNTGDIDQTTKIESTQEQNVNQDNDVNTDINGNSNTVVNNQDNSIRQYGGDHRSMVINEANTGNQGGGANSAYYNAADKAITMATLGGFYDVDDSPAARASFVDQSVTMNRDNQKRYAGAGLATAAQYTNFDPGVVNMENLQSSVDSASQQWFDRAKVQEVKTYGDRAAVTDYADFKFGDPIEEITSNASDIADDYKDDIDDM